MIENHINPSELRVKIIQLFEYRLFPTFLEQIKWVDNHQRITFLESLIQLQTAIYHLDAHLEAHWETDETVLMWHWQQIEQYLIPFGMEANLISDYIAHIKKYESHELGIRQNKSLLRLNLEYFYFYKSCDVKLLRRLIYERGNLSPRFGKLSDWRYYDLITEVNDDVEDIFEDLDFVNGNLVLIQLIKDGKEATLQNFSNFIDLIKQKASESFAVDRTFEYKEYIYTETLARIDETLELLRINIEKITQQQIDTARINKLGLLMIQTTKA